jgi:NAD(P)-dependent dehydrogenase (short-subunit alcohol dehydrogenase family)
MARLSGKIAVVTGASCGIGAAIARAFVAEGATVYLTDVNDELGASLAQTLGPNAFYERLDVREPEDWERVMARVRAAHGRLDVLVNNAGILGIGNGSVAQDPENASLADWREVHRTNLDSVFLGCKYAIRMMRPNRAGSIINMSSRAGFVGVPRAAAYASSKGAIRNHTKSVALYCAQEGLNIRCNSIHPGSVVTPIWEPMFGPGVDRDARLKSLAADTPLRRFGTAEEIAAIAVMLASDEVTFMTGSELTADGGVQAGSAIQPGSR